MDKKTKATWRSFGDILTSGLEVGFSSGQVEFIFRALMWTDIIQTKTFQDKLDRHSEKMRSDVETFVKTGSWPAPPTEH